MKKTKRLLLLLFAVSLVISGGIWAFALAGRGQGSIVHNNLRLPNLEGVIDENFEPSAPIEIGGAAVEKDVRIENTGDTGLFVRVMAFAEIKVPYTDPQGNSAPQLLPARIGEAGDGTEIIVTIDSNWQDGGDGYYYYKLELPPGTPADGSTPAVLSYTSSLFTEVALADNLGSSYNGAEFDIQLKSETITSANHSYRKVWWNLDTSTPPTDASLQAIDNVLDPLTSNL